MPKAPKPKPLKPVARRKAAFDAAHEAGMNALKRKDYSALGNAIKREKDIIAAGTPRSRKRTK